MRIKNWHVIAVLSCILWAVYYPALFAPLCSVDDVRLVNDLLNRPEIGWVDVWFPRSTTYYRPLISGSFILDLLLWHLETPFLHFENILFHWINALLVFVLARLAARKLGIDVMLVPFVAALAFALHPINTEAVIWVAGRADLLACTFILLSLICTIRYLDSANRLWLPALMLVFVTGCLAKETVLFVLPGIGLFSLLLRKQVREVARQRWAAVWPVIICLLGSTGYFLLRSYVLRDRDLGLQHVAYVASGSPDAPSVVATQTFSLSARFVEIAQTALAVAGFYLRKLMQPFPLNFGIVDVPDGYWLVGCLLLIFAFVLILRLTWAGCFFLTAMSLGSIALLVALGDISWTPVAERYMYSPAAMTMIGCTLASAEALQKHGKKGCSAVLRWCLPLLFLVAAAGVLQRGIVWQDNLTLFSDTVAKSPDFALAKSELAIALLQRGHKKDALALLATSDVPDSQPGSLSKALVFVEQGRLGDARTFLLDKLQAENSQAYRTGTLKMLDKILGMLRDKCADLEQAQDYDRERIDYLKQLLHSSGDPFYLYRIGLLQMTLGEYVEARESFSAAHNSLPEDSIYKAPAGKLAEKMRNK